MDEVAAASLEERRTAVLNHAIGSYVEHGYQVESVHGHQAVVAKRRSVFTLFNAVMTVLTVGVWLLFVIVQSLDPLVDRAVLTVDADGKLHGRFS